MGNSRHVAAESTDNRCCLAEIALRVRSERTASGMIAYRILQALQALQRVRLLFSMGSFHAETTPCQIDHKTFKTSPTLPSLREA
jgi:hypothetical protein